MIVHKLSGLLKDTNLVWPLGGAQYPDLLKSMELPKTMTKQPTSRLHV